MDQYRVIGITVPLIKAVIGDFNAQSTAVFFKNGEL